MKKNDQVIILLVLAAFCLTATAGADLAITEIMVQSAQSLAQGDWWELTNTGPSSVDLTDYSWDNSSQTPGINVFGDVSIASGEHIIVFNAFDSSEVSSWKTLWGLGSEVNVYRFSFLDSEFSNEDGLFLYNPSDVLVTSVEYTTAAYGASNGWEASGTFLGFSIIGENGAYESSDTPSDVGSPGYAVPEPATIALLALGGLALRKKRVV